jgi:hypothetical protein
MANAIHGICRLFEWTLRLAMPVMAKEPQTSAPGDVVVSLDLQAKYPLVRDNNDEIGFARELRLVVGQIQGVKHDPVSGTRVACKPFVDVSFSWTPCRRV